MKFLTAFDDRVFSDGSIDPLGLTPIWVGFSRRFISNLTTVTTSTHDVLTVLLAAAIAADHPHGQGLLMVEPFLRFEQLAAFTRTYYNIGQTVRGVRLVSKRLQTKLRLDHKEQILSNQRAYGLWGYYTGPLTESDLLIYDRRLEGYVLSETACDAVHSLLSSMSSTKREQMRTVLLQESCGDDTVVRSMMNNMKTLFTRFSQHDDTRVLIREQFAKGAFSGADERVATKQQLLYALMPRTNDVLQEAHIQQLIDCASKSTDGHDLAEDLRVLLALDHVLGNARRLFDFIRHKEFTRDSLREEIESAKWNAVNSVDDATRALTGIRLSKSIEQGRSLDEQWSIYLDSSSDIVAQVDALFAIHDYIVAARRTARWVDRTNDGQYHPKRSNGATRVLDVNRNGALTFGYFLPSMQRLKCEL